MPSVHYPEAKLSKAKLPCGQNTLYNHVKLQHYQEKNAKLILRGKESNVLIIRSRGMFTPFWIFSDRQNLPLNKRKMIIIFQKMKTCRKVSQLREIQVTGGTKPCQKQANTLFLDKKEYYSLLLSLSPYFS